MDPVDSGQGPDQGCHISPSSKGRQRKKNPKYLDYETEEVTNVQRSPRKTQRQSSGRGKGAASEKSPVKNGTNEDTTQQTEDGGQDETDKTLSESDETPKKAVRAKKTPAKKTPAKKTQVKKTPAKKTPAKKTPAKKTPAKKTPAKQTPTLMRVSQLMREENGTPKPKRKYVKKQQPVKEVVIEEPPNEAEEETTPSGRRRRGAAKVALKYLHDLAKEELGHPNDDLGSQPENKVPHTERKGLKENKGGKGRKRKRADSDSAGDEDFVPDAEAFGRTPGTYNVNRGPGGPYVKTPNGLHSGIMKTVWDATETTKKFREEHYSSWEFPKWIPSSSDWHLVPQSDVEKYLPQELQSAAFRVSRDGLSEEGETPLQRLSRFSAMPAHSERWDMFLFAGGPVWAMEWCPTPDGAPASQYLAVSCHRGMDDQHVFNKTYGGPALLQLWDLGLLKYNCRPESPPALSYGLAQDKGFIWQLSWCPAGGWEPPLCGRKTGSPGCCYLTGVVTIYSLPHPEALLSNNSRKTLGKTAEGVLTLKLGSFKAPRHERSGQVLCMDWLPEKPHNIIAIGFYDGTVGLWDLNTKSALLRVRQPDKSLSLLPYRCFLAHDHAVRALAFCPASRHLLVSAGEDRYLKTWDLRRLYNPITVQKRHLTTEVCWPLNAPGLLLSQENAYAGYFSQGVHFFDHQMRSVFAIPRTGTLWSLSYTEWMNIVMTADSVGEVILFLLPQLSVTTTYVKRTLERRFPLYITSLEPHDSTTEENPQLEEVEEDGDAVEASEGGNENNNVNGGSVENDKSLSPRVQTYKDAEKRFSLHLKDVNTETFAGSDKGDLWKHMKNTELKMKLTLDEMPLASVHKVRFNPNLCCHTWLVSGGQAGLVRIICLRSMICSQSKKIISEKQTQFNKQNATKQTEADVHSEKEDL
ncbi:General transcription factor 3C polypeptide 2 [Dissostichus eleginoides]|uniref:General transcription factor 3C polypeptide 2 n=1 Tax=Dissostichus eleginoides TaxID=100907 RepID=A0AAD9F5D9_DISEL|nr:General transcription factor 3C polypeptide 2 [Dissostichus eleginoides]